MLHWSINVRFKDGEYEHDDEEEEVGREHGHVVDVALNLRHFNLVWKRGRRREITTPGHMH